jgi:hypothetical protein
MTLLQQIFSTVKAAPTTITGRGISRRHLSDDQRAALAVELMNGTIRLEQLSLKQAAAVTGASVAGVFRTKYHHRNGNGNGV